MELAPILTEMQISLQLTPRQSWDLFAHSVEQIYGQETGYHNVTAVPYKNTWRFVVQKTVKVVVHDPNLECSWDEGLKWAPRCVPEDFIQIPFGPHYLKREWEQWATAALRQLIQQTERQQHIHMAHTWQNTLQQAYVLRVQPDHTVWLKIGPFECYLKPEDQVWPWHLSETRSVYVRNLIRTARGTLRLNISEKDINFTKTWLTDNLPILQNHGLTLKKIARHPKRLSIVAVSATSASRFRQVIHQRYWQPPAWQDHPIYHTEKIAWIRTPNPGETWPDILAQWTQGKILEHDSQNRMAVLAVPKITPLIGPQGITARLWNQLTGYTWHFQEE